MTVPEMLRALKPAKPVARWTLYKYLSALKIKPVGTLRQCPQQYPDDSVEKILASLGLKNTRPRHTNGKAKPRNGNGHK